MRFKLAFLLALPLHYLSTFLFALPLRYLSAFLATLLFAASASAQNYTIQPPPPSWGPVWTIPQPQQTQPQQQPQLQYQAPQPVSEPVAQSPVRDDAIVVDMNETSPQANAPQNIPQFEVPQQQAPQYQTALPPVPVQTRPARINTEAAAVNAPTKVSNQGSTRSANQMALNSRGLSSAVSCAAALQIAALAAPGWSSEHGVAEATNLWLERVFTEADKAAVSGDRVNVLVKEEMEKQTNASVNDPNIISRKAFDCATNRPA